MSKRKIMNSNNFASNYRFTMMHNAVGWISGVYRHDKYGFVSIQSEERFTSIRLAIGNRTFITNCEPGSICNKTVEVIVSRTLIPQIEQDIKDWEESK